MTLFLCMYLCVHLSIPLLCVQGCCLSTYTHAKTDTFLLPPSLLLIETFTSFCAQAYKVMTMVDSCFWLKLTQIKLFQLIQSTDVSQDPMLLDIAFFPVNNKSLFPPAASLPLPFSFLPPLVMLVQLTTCHLASFWKYFYPCRGGFGFTEVGNTPVLTWALNA